MTSCPICCADYNKALRSQVTCYFPSCSFSGCKECVRTYLTSVTTDPHCMNCRNKWSLEFTKSALNAAFMDKDYKAHRRTILADREIAKTQEYYQAALVYGRKTEGDQKIAEIRREIEENNEKNSKLYRQIDEIRREIDSNQGGESGRKFVMQCQNNGCRGMLTTQYKCDLCTKFTCTKCFVCIVDGNRDEHECKPEDVATVEELRKNTRPCPACGLRISKIDGCDQMWCIECKTAFSWSKGTVEKGTVHNPHYYQWMREHGGGMPPTQGNNCQGRDFADALRRVNPIINYIKNWISCYEKFVADVRGEVLKKNSAQTTIESMLAKNFESMLEIIVPLQTELDRVLKCISSYHRFIVHMEYTALRPLHTVLRAREMKKTHIYDYILNVIEKDELADELIRIDGQNMKDRAESDILEALVAVGSQIMTECSGEIIAEYEKFPNLATTYENQLRDKWHLTRFKETFLKVHTVCTPEILISLITTFIEILTKHLTAADRYSAYSNMEYIKMLMVYSSKKGVTMWDHRLHCMHHTQFATKGEMRERLALLSDFYDGKTPVSTAASEAADY